MDLARLFGRRRRRTVIEVELNARLQPVDRHALYEVPLEEDLRRRHVETLVDGGGTALDARNRIVGCALVITTLDPDPRLVRASVVSGLERIGVPRGSRARLGDTTLEFGNQVGLLVSLPSVTTIDRLDARNLPRNDELDDLLAVLQRELRGVGRIASFRIHEGLDTELYVYGEDRARMRDVLTPALTSTSLGADAVVSDLD